jgi:hypothetical protein
LGKQIGQSNDRDGEMLELILEIIGWGVIAAAVYLWWADE